MKIVALDGIPLNPGDVSWAPIEKMGELVVFDDTRPRELEKRVQGADIILTNKVPLRKKDLPLLSDCKMIGVLATGVNVVDVQDFTQNGITVCNVPGYGVEDVAEHALALLLELARNTTIHSQGVKEGDWERSGWCYWHKAPLALAGLTMGIIGFGAIGQTMGRYANALGMKVLAYAPHRKAKTDYPFTYVELDELLANADVISLHCPLTPDNEKMINARALGKMKDGAILINTARGGLVDEEATAKALSSGKLGGLGTDVLGKEPPDAANPLLKAPNTLITPHMAWATKRARQKIIDIMAENISAFLSGKPQNTVG